MGGIVFRFVLLCVPLRRGTPRYTARPASDWFGLRFLIRHRIQNIMKKYLFLLFAILLSCQVRLFAVPARPLPVTVTQSDGTTLVVRLCGDEFFHWYETSDGIPLVQAGNGDYCYAVPTPTGFASSGVVAHEKARRTAAELHHAATARRNMPKAASQHRAAADRPAQGGPACREPQCLCGPAARPCHNGRIPRPPLPLR